MKQRLLSIRAMVGSIVLIVCILAGISQNCTASDMGINVEDYSQYVIDLGGENEDWQPAFQQALTACSNTGATLFVPCGTYNIRQEINVPGLSTGGFGDPGRLTIKGAGRYQSAIVQQDDTKNVMNWTGATYEESYAGGTLRDISLFGGKTCLNIKWHNQFKMLNCFINGAEDYGVYAEGWSGRFINSTFNWCYDTALYGGEHFNNIVIRDCYFRRSGIAIHLDGGRGIRIEGCGLESNANSAIFARGALGLTISSCYFEINGYELPAYFEIGLGFPSAVHLDYACKGVLIQGNIFRESAPSLSMSYCLNASVINNAFYNYNVNSGSLGILLRNEQEVGSSDPYVAQTIVKNNYFENVEQWLGEEEPGLIDEAITRNCQFQKYPGADFVSSEQLGSEMMVDGNMELSGVTNWRNTYTPLVKEKSSTYAHGGSRSLHIVSDSSGDGVHQVFSPSPLEVGKTYKITLWVKNMDIEEYLNIKLSGTDLNKHLKTYNTGWEPLFFYTTYTSYVSTPYLTFGYGTATSDVYIDDVSFKEVISSDLF